MSGSAIPGSLAAELGRLFGGRFVTSEAIRLEHGKSETHFVPMPPDAVVYG